MLIRKRHHKRATHSHLRLYGNLSAQPFNDALANGEPQSRSLNKIIQLLKTVKNQRQFLTGYSAPGVGHIHLQPLPFRRQAQCNGTLARVFNGIGKEIKQHLRNPVPVHHNPDFLIRTHHLKADTRFHLQAVHLLHLVNQSCHLGQLDVHFRLSGLDAREVEDVVDELQQQVAILLNDIQILRFLLFIFRQGNDFGKTDNGIQRGTDFVAHVCQEYRLHPVGLFCPLLRFNQFIGTLNPVADVVYQSHHLVAFKRGYACLEVMPFAIIHVQRILNFLQLAVFKALVYVAQKQIADFGRVDGTPVGSLQLVHRMKQNRIGRHQYIGYEEIVVKDEYEFGQCLDNFPVPLFYAQDVGFPLALLGDVYGIAQQAFRLSVAIRLHG